MSGARSRVPSDRRLIEELRERQARLYRELALCYHSLARAALPLGWPRLDAIGVRPEGPCKVRLQERHYLGVDLPHLILEPISPRPGYSPAGSNSLLDLSRKRFIQLLPLIVECAEREAHLFSLSQALKKTMKRVNALENIFIPDYTDTVHYVAETLEEMEREEMYIQKLVKESRS